MRTIPYTEQCSTETFEAFPDLRFEIDGLSYYIPRDSYVIRYFGKCYLKLMTHYTIPFWILGLNFFENYYTIFDQENLKVGFAPSIHQKKLKSISTLSNANLIFTGDVAPESSNTILYVALGAAALGLGSAAYLLRKKASNKNEYRRSSNDMA